MDKYKQYINNPEYEFVEYSNEYKQGGIYSGAATAEVEKKEMIQHTDGSTSQVNGPSHEMGGIPVNLENGARIFSDRLKVKGKTFAKLASKYKTDKEEKLLSDTKATMRDRQSAQLNMATKTKKLDELFMTQEGMKAKKINSYIKRYGDTQKYPYGGLIPEPIADPESLYNPVTGEVINRLDAIYPAQPTDFLSNVQGQFDNTGIPVNTNTPEPFQQLPSINQNQISNQPVTGTINQTVQSLPEGDPTLLQQGMNVLQSTSDMLNKNKSTLGKVGSEAAMFGVNNLANLAYLKNEGKRYDKVDYGQVNPNLVSDQESIRQIREGYNTGLYNMRNSGNLSQSGRVALTGERMKQGAAAKERVGNINAGIQNQFAQYNKGLQIQGMTDEAANRGQAKTNYYNALGSLGQNTAMQSRDYKQRAMDEKKLNLIKDIFPDYSFNPSTFEYMYKLAQKGK